MSGGHDVFAFNRGTGQLEVFSRNEILVASFALAPGDFEGIDERVRRAREAIGQAAPAHPPSHEAINDPHLVLRLILDDHRKLLEWIRENLDGKGHGRTRDRIADRLEMVRACEKALRSMTAPARSRAPHD